MDAPSSVENKELIEQLIDYRIDDFHWHHYEHIGRCLSEKSNTYYADDIFLEMRNVKPLRPNHKTALHKDPSHNKKYAIDQSKDSAEQEHSDNFLGRKEEPIKNTKNEIKSINIGQIEEPMEATIGHHKLIQIVSVCSDERLLEIWNKRELLLDSDEDEDLVFKEIYRRRGEIIGHGENNPENDTSIKEPLSNERKIGQLNPKRRGVFSSQAYRDSAVKKYVLSEADGICECCENNAPFTKDNGEPYLEVHHLIALSEEGPDTISNTVALCPNCHSELHYGINKKLLKDSIYQKIDRLTR